MYQILDLLSKQKLKYFRYLKQKFYKELVNGFYVYAKKKEKEIMIPGKIGLEGCVSFFPFIFVLSLRHFEAKVKISVQGNEAKKK